MTTTIGRRIALFGHGAGGLRLLRAVRELEYESQEELTSVGVVAPEGRRSWLARECRELAIIPSAEPTVEALVEALVGARVDMVWASSGDGAFRAGLAEACEARGWTFVGPAARVLWRLSDHAEVSAAAKAVGLEVAADGEAQAEQAGLRRLEVPVASDLQGHRWALDVVDTSLRRDGGVVISEAPALGLEAEIVVGLKRAALQVAEHLGHTYVGAMAFLFDPSRQQARFLGYRLCCPGDFACAELRRGVDLTKLQLRLALGERVEADLPPAWGHAATVEVEVVRDGEGPVLMEHFRLAGGQGVRVDAGATEGEVLTPPASAARITARGRDRREALARLHRSLQEGSVLVQNGETSMSLLSRLLHEEEVLRGPVDVGWLQDRLQNGAFRGAAFQAVALVAAAIEAYESDHAAARAQFHAWAKRGRSQVEADCGRRVELLCGGHSYDVEVRQVERASFEVVAEGQVIPVEVQEDHGPERHLVMGDRRYRVASVRDGLTHRVEVNGEPHRVTRAQGGLVRAPAPAVVSEIAVQPGEIVAAGAPIAVLEAMKTETTLHAPFGGRVREVLVRRNVQVGPGAPLVWIEPSGRTPDAPRGPRITVPELLAAAGSGTAPASAERPLAVFRSLLAGYDVPPEELRRAIAAYRRLEAADVEIWRQEEEVLARYMVLVELTPSAREREEEPGLHLSRREYLRSYLMDIAARGEGMPQAFLHRLSSALQLYGVEGLEPNEALLDAMFRLHLALARGPEVGAVVVAVLGRHVDGREPAHATVALRQLLDRIIAATQSGAPEVCDLARTVRFARFDQPFLSEVFERVSQEAEAAVERLCAVDDPALMDVLVRCPQSLSGRFLHSTETQRQDRRRVILEAIARRYYRVRELLAPERVEVAGQPVFTGGYREPDGEHALVAWLGDLAQVPEVLALLEPRLAADLRPVDLELYAWRPADQPSPAAEAVARMLAEADLPSSVARVVLAVGSQVRDGRGGAEDAQCLTFRRGGSGFVEDQVFRGIHPMVADRLRLGRLEAFELERVENQTGLYAFVGRGRANPEDRRIFVYGEVRDLTPARDEAGALLALPQLERVVADAFAILRRVRAGQGRSPSEWNRVELFGWPSIALREDELMVVAKKIAPASLDIGLEKVSLSVLVPGPEEGFVRRVVEVSNPDGHGMVLRIREPSSQPLLPLTKYEQRVMKLRARGLMYPYELIRILTPTAERASLDLPEGRFEEHDLDAEGKLAPVARPPGQNTANIVVGLLRSFTSKYPEGMTRVALFGDPSRAMGSLAEPECRRIIAALSLAEGMRVPLEWYAVSAGAEISTERGTENMDWISAVLKKIVEHTQAGNELNVVVCNINVGAQPYWNAEATMLMHTKGILVMVPEAAMVLTGKQALDYSGGVSAEDNLGIGGYERIMGPNGQAQFLAADLVEAGKLLLRYYDHTYRVPGERYPRARVTTDPVGRDVSSSPHGDVEEFGFATVGDVFSTERNPGRKRPFDIRRIMAATVDQDAEPLERWRDMRDAETVVVWEAHLGGHPVCLLGFESHPIRRLGFIPADGPLSWTAGTLFPLSSKKAARAINAASGNRPLVILANLSGFDGSPESLRNWQLENGAEIGRAVVNFDGPIVFCVVSRFHGGAFVVFSNQLNPRMHTVALEGTHASVIGGAPAAAVVFARELKSRTAQDPRVVAAQAELARAEGADKAWATVRLNEAMDQASSDALGALAQEYDAIHSIQRAKRVGSVHAIIPPNELRPYVIAAVRRGMREDLPS
jgi:acetyl/propionyl-CoA carboxylase alpha subunit/acetyl-CoA carboxylase carboxyltransferase component